MGECLKETESLCPICLARIPARYAARGGQVWLEKTCPQHGFFDAPVWGDAQGFSCWMRESPAQPPAPPLRVVNRGCPYDCGLCAAHKQASCCVLLEVTHRCNLACPVCYASAGQGAIPLDPDLDTVLSWFDLLLEQGGPFNIQLSGGEPTQRDDLPYIIETGQKKGFSFFQLNTNGIRIAEQPGYLRQMADAGLNTVFLQFDSLDPEGCAALRGRDLVALKKQAVHNCGEAGVGVVLVPTVKPGVNLAHMGALVDFAAQNIPVVRGVHFQPISYFGRYGAQPAPVDRLPIPTLLQALEAQTGGRVKAGDFSPGSAEHALCTFHADYTIEGGEWTARPSSPSCCCSTGSSDRAREAVASKWAAPPDAEAAFSSAYDLRALDAFLEKKARHTLALSGMAFQDVWTADLNRLCRCHVHVVTRDNRLAPFCAHNITSVEGAQLHGSQDK